MKKELCTTQRRLEDATSNVRQLRSLLMHAENTMAETTQELRAKVEQQQQTIEQLKAQRNSSKTNGMAKMLADIKIEKGKTVQGSTSSEKKTACAANLAEIEIIEIFDDSEEEDRKPAAKVSGRKQLSIKSSSKAPRKTRSTSSESQNESGTDAPAQGDAKMPTVSKATRKRRSTASESENESNTDTLAQFSSSASRKRRATASESEFESATDTLVQGDAEMPTVCTHQIWHRVDTCGGCPMNHLDTETKRHFYSKKLQQRRTCQEGFGHV
eukprot:scaffold287_cov173-Amphora_coffeaeformis.AAC.24